MKSGIDFVIIWVDGSDREWQKTKNHYLKIEKGIEVDSNQVRYRDWDLLKYWFRAVETYAPWVDQVHFVTCGQMPEWMNPNAPKLKLVNHADYIPEEYLPTFSSHPIELNLHRIPGLSERFVYFNDDFFLAAPVTPRDFFVHGLPCDCIEERPIEFTKREIYNSILINDIIFTNRHFNRLQNRKEHRKLWYSLNTPHITVRNLLMSIFRAQNFFGLNTHHLPQAYRKETFREVWEAEHDWLDETCSHRFRSPEDVSQVVLKNWQLMKGTFTPYNKRKFGKVFLIEQDLQEIRNVLLNQKYKAVCLNDDPAIQDFDGTKQKLIEIFEQVFPEKSSFEI